MGQPLIDTSVFSTYNERIDGKADSYYFSSVVFYELIASMIDQSTLQKYASWESSCITKRLITPGRTDWIVAAKCVRRLRHLKLINKNLSATTLQNDALIARCASMHNCFVVTDNIRDFTLLQKVMLKLEVIPATEYFG